MSGRAVRPFVRVGKNLLTDVPIWQDQGNKREGDGTSFLFRLLCVFAGKTKPGPTPR